MFLILNPIEWSNVLLSVTYIMSPLRGQDMSYQYGHVIVRSISLPIYAFARVMFSVVDIHSQMYDLIQRNCKKVDTICQRIVTDFLPTKLTCPCFFI